MVKRFILQRPIKRMVSSILVCSFLIGVTLWMLLPEWPGWPTRWMEAVADTIDEAQMQDVNDKTDVTYSILKYNRRTGNMSLNAVITNTSSESLPKPMYLVVDSITSGQVQLLQSHGNTASGNPYFDMSALITGSVLAPGASTRALTFELHNPDRVRFDLNLTVYISGIPAPNNAPVITSFPVTTGEEGVAYSYDVDATDADGDSLTYALTVSPPGMSIDAVTGMIIWTPSAAQVDSHDVTVQVTDGRGGAKLQSFTITVQESNEPPTADPDGPYTAKVGQMIMFDGSGSTDPDNDILECTWDFGDGTTSKGVSLSHTYDSAGEFTVMLTVEDGHGGTDAAATTATLVEVILNVSITEPVDGAITNTTPVVVHGSVSDPDSRVMVQNVIASVSETTFEAAGVALLEGPNELYAQARNNAGSQATAMHRVVLDTTPPVIAILSPPERSVSTSDTVEILAVVDDATDVTCLIDGVPATMEDDLFKGTVILVEGENIVTVTAEDASGNTSSESLTLYLDTEPLFVIGVEPADGAIDVDPNVSVTVSYSEAVDPLSVHAASLYLRADSMLLWADITTSGDGLTSTLAPTLPLPSGTAIDVIATSGITDLAGNPLQGPFMSQFTTSGDVIWSGVALGEVYDDTRSLPLEAVAVEAFSIDTGQILDTVQTDDRGRYLIRPGQAPALIKVSKPEFTTVERLLAVPEGEYAEILDARLTPLSDPQMVDAVLGAELNDPLGDQLTIPPGALAEDTAVMFTPISQQGPRNLFPPGWIPLGIVEIHGPEIFQVPASLILVDRSGAASEKQAVVARYDGSSGKWIAVANVSVTAEGLAQLDQLTEPGQYALLLPDEGNGAPDLAIPGEPLPEGTEEPIPDDAAASGVVEPPTGRADDPTPARATVTITSETPLRSGTPILGDFTELFILRDGERISPLDTSQDFFAYRSPADIEGRTLTLSFPIAPSQVFNLAEILEGTITVVLSHHAIVERDVIGNTGGGIQTEDGIRLIIPPGVLGCDIPVNVRRIDAGAISVDVPEELVFIGGCEVDLSGRTSSESLIVSIENIGSFVRTGSQVIVAELRHIQGRDRLVFVALARIDGDAVTTVTQVNGLTLPGIRKGGRYLFYRFDGELEVVAGTARDETGRRDGHLVELEGFPFVSVTNASGLFAVPSPPGVFTLIATGAVIHDQVRVEWNTGVPLPEIVIVPTPPTVERITVRPPKIEGYFAGPVVLLGKPKPVIDDDIEGESSGNGDGQIDTGERIELSLAVRNDGTVAVSGGYFVLSVLTTGGAVDVTPSSIRVDLLPPDEPVIVGPFVFEVPADIGPAELRYRLAYYTDTALSREHLFQLPLGVDHSNVSVHSEITVYFSEPVTAQVLQTAVILEKESETGLLPVSTKVLTNEDNTAFIVRPLETLADDAIYQVRLADTIVDLDGHQLVDATLVERFSTEDLTPPGPIEPGKIEASVPDENGMVNITGSLGSVNPDDIVIVLNETTGFTAFAEPNPDGSFSASVQAEITDQITIIVRDRNDNEIRIPVDTLIRRDPITGEIISVVFGRGGGTFTNADGIGLTVPEGALLGPTELSVSRVDEPFTLPPDIASDPDLVAAFESHFSVVDRMRIDASTYSFAQPVRLSLPPPAGSTPDDLFLIVRPRELTVGGVLVDLDEITGLTAIENPIRTVERLEVLDTATVKEMDGEMVLSTDSPPFSGITEPGDVTLLLVEVTDTKMFFAGEVRRDTATGRRVSGAVVQGLPTAEETSAFAAVTDRDGEFAVLSALTEGPFPEGSVVLSRLDVRDPSFERVVRRDVRGTVGSPSPPNAPVAHLVEPFVLPAVLPPELVDVLGDIEPPEVAIHVDGPSFSGGISFVGDPLNITVYAQDNDSVEFVSLKVDQGSGFEVIPLSEYSTGVFVPSTETLVTMRAQAQDRSKNVTSVDRYVRTTLSGAVVLEPLPDQPPVVIDEPGQEPLDQTGTGGDGGTGGGDGGTGGDGTQPTDEQSPVMFSENKEIPFDGEITVGFSEPLDENTVNVDSVRLLDPEGELVQIEVEVEDNGALIRITPRRNLRLGATYKVELDASIRDLDGDNFDGATYSIDVQPIRHLATISLPNASDVAVGQNGLVVINHPDSAGIGDRGKIWTYQVWDAEDPSRFSGPKLLGSGPVNGRPLSLAIDGNRAFVGNRFLGPIATKDLLFVPYFPTMNTPMPDTLLVCSVFPLTTVPYCMGFSLIWGNLPSPPSNLEVFDLTDPANPERTGGKALNYVPQKDLWNPNTWPTRVEATNQGIAVVNFLDNIEFFSSAPQPERVGLVGRVKDYGEVVNDVEFYDAAFFDGFAVALVRDGASSMSTALSVISNPLIEVGQVGSFSLSGTLGGRIGCISNFKVQDPSGSSYTSNLVFYTQRNSGLTILTFVGGSLSELRTLPGVFGNMSFDKSRGIAYFHGANGQFHVVDFNDPTRPIELNDPGQGKSPFRVPGMGAKVSLNGNSNRDCVVFLTGDSGVAIVDLSGEAVPDIGFVLTDITRFRPVDSEDNTAAGYERIPPDIEPDGIACDGLAGVDDGAQFLLRVIVPDWFYEYTQTHPDKVTIEFGYIPESGSIEPLPGSGDSSPEGRFIEPTEDDIDALRALKGWDKPSLAMEGDVFKPGRKVFRAMIYKPPIEFDLQNPGSKRRERLLDLAAELSGEITSDQNKKIKIDITLIKRITLTRPPLVLVHGINSGPDMWKEEFDDEFIDHGYNLYFADHSSKYDGNGDIHESYEFVRDKIFKEDEPSALNDYRNGSAFSGKKIAVQKADIVAHSYGGLLSRWYTEQSDEFKTRKDARKLITMGTPHRGSPVTNMMIEIYQNPLFFNGRSQTLALTLGQLLGIFNSGEVRIFWKNVKLPIRIRWHDRAYLKQSARAQDGTPTQEGIVPSLQVMTIGSAVIKQLNGEPFRDDIAYASIVGTNHIIGSEVHGTPVRFNAFDALVPYYDAPLPIGSERSYFPWVSYLDGGDGQSDAIVPIWSQILPKKSKEYGENHLTYTGNSELRSKLREWLQDPDLPRGQEHREEFKRLENPTGGSWANAYKGSELNGTQSTGGGVRPDAIVQVKLSDKELGSQGGIVNVTCTGMIDNTVRSIEIMGREAPLGGIQLGSEITLHVDIEPQLSGVSAELMTFSATGKIARNQTGSLLGPDGQNPNPSAGVLGVTWEISYRMGGTVYANWKSQQSPPTQISFPAFELPIPEGPSIVAPESSIYVLKGGVNVADNSSPGAQQTVRVLMKDHDPLPDEVLDDIIFKIDVPSNAFIGALIPYEVETRLIIDHNGHIRGPSGTSHESETDVYQELDQEGVNPNSGLLRVKASPIP